jgi:hypothetical protein
MLLAVAFFRFSEWCDILSGGDWMGAATRRRKGWTLHGTEFKSALSFSALEKKTAR